jgi:hypothetical protein
MYDFNEHRIHVSPSRLSAGSSERIVSRTLNSGTRNLKPGSEASSVWNVCKFILRLGQYRPTAQPPKHTKGLIGIIGRKTVSYC